MSGYHEFISERRRENRRQKIVTAASAGALLLLLIAGCVAAVYGISGGLEESDGQANTLRSSAKSVEAACHSTDFQKTCQNSLSKSINSTGPVDPKDLIKASVSVLMAEVDQAFNISKIKQLLKTDDPAVHGAVEECRQLFYETKDDVARSLQSIVAQGMRDLPKRSIDLQTWLSAVMSYLQACVDGFPKGELRDEMEKDMVTAKQMTSNALAIISQASSFLSSVDLTGVSRRRLLADQVDHEGFPYWLSGDDRRVLAAHPPRGGLKLTPNVTVAKDGSGNYTSINQALASLPPKYNGRYVIYVKAGVYEEYVTVTNKMTNITMYGDGSTKTTVTGNKNFVDGVRTYMTATFAAQGDGFMAIGMGFRNSAGPEKHQAVALRVQSDRSIFLNCRMDGYQDTLYAQTYRQFYRACVITGTVDYIFGDATAVFQKCVMIVRRPLNNQQNIVTAQGRIDRQETTGFVLHNCRIVPEDKLALPDAAKIPSYLGRPWKACSRTIIMESEIGGFIHPDGYLKWDGADESVYSSLYYGEYQNKGLGAKVDNRVKWPGFKVLSKNTALSFTVDNFLQAQDWLRGTGTPVRLGLYN